MCSLVTSLYFEPVGGILPRSNKARHFTGYLIAIIYAIAPPIENPKI